MAETLRRSSLGAVGRRRPGQPRARRHPAHPPRRPHGAGPRRRRRHASSPARPASTGRSCASRCPAGLARYVVEKGSIAVDGVSLTVSAVSAADDPEPWFEVSLIPTTLRETTLGARAPGDPVNLEVDVIAKYVERLLGGTSMSAAPGPARHASRRAIAAIKDGRPVVVIDDEDRENEGDLIFASELATPELVAFMVRYTSGYICVAGHRGRRRPARPAADVPGQPGPPRHRVHRHRRRPRGRHHRHLRLRPGAHHPAAGRRRRRPSADLARPGHIVPLRAKDGGVLRRPGHTEAAVDLAVLAGPAPVRHAVRDRQREGPDRHGPRRGAARLRRRARPRA